MSDANDGLRALGERGGKLLPARELLRVTAELFVELMSVEVGHATEDDLARVSLLRQALAEINERAGRLCPLMSPAACSCGETFATADDLDEHFWTVFVPNDDTGLDGRKHAEIVQD